MHTAMPVQHQTPANRWALVILSLSILLSSLGTSIANVALPTLAEAFDASFQQVQWVVLAYLLAITTLIVSVGRLGDLIGRRRLLLAGLLLFSLASALCGIAPSLWLLIAARAAQGLGAAVMMALAMALVGDMVPKAKTGRAMGLLGTMSAVGTALGPTLGRRSDRRVRLARHLPGRGAAGAPDAPDAPGWPRVILPATPARPKTDRTRLDVVGTLLLAATLGAYALAVTVGRGSFGGLNLALLLACAGGIGLFVFAESRVAAPLVKLEMFRNPVLSAGLVSSTLVLTVAMATLVVGPFYLSQALGLDPAAVGLVMSTGPIFSALSGVPSGRLVDRLGAPAMSVVGLAAMAAGAAALAALPATLGVAGYIAALAILTPGYQLFQVPPTTRR